MRLSNEKIALWGGLHDQAVRRLAESRRRLENVAVSHGQFAEAIRPALQRIVAHDEWLLQRITINLQAYSAGDR